jgi:putative transposase
MNLYVNQLIEWLDDQGQSHIERILWIDSSHTDTYLFDVQDPKAMPVWRRMADLVNWIEQGDARVLAADPFLVGMRSEEDISDLHRTHRDQAWTAIRPLVERNDGTLFVANKRGAIVEAACLGAGVSKPTIYSYLRRYWRGGQTKNALLPAFDRRGGKGKEKSAGECKRGRPPRRAQNAQETGINVDDAIKTKFQRGTRLYYENREGRSLTEAYQLVMEHLFNLGYEKRGETLVPVLPPVSELPTFGQFRYWYEKERDLESSFKRRLGDTRYALTRRPVVGDSTKMANGPGSLYQIDATVDDIYLVSRADRNRIIGRPVVYLVQDVFSRLITGIAVTLEGPSWLGAILALENTSSDKTPFCQEFGIDDIEWWPAQHLPEAILADRGELEGYNADNLVNSLGIRVSNTPPYRADGKGIIEQSFRLSHLALVHHLPGAVRKPRERGEHDYRQDAVLTLHEYTHLAILWVRNFNLHHYLDDYPLTEDMVAAGVDPYPIDLWNWGIVNRSGHLRTVPRDILRLNLLPGGEASVTPRGIQFRGALYTTERAMREQWYVRARSTGTFRVPVAYDPRLMEVVYLRLDAGRQIEPCLLTERHQRWRGYSWWEYEASKQVQAEKAVTRDSRDRQAGAEFHAEVRNVVKRAQVEAEKTSTSQSKQARVRDIRTNRRSEKEEARAAGVWRLGKTVSPETHPMDIGAEEYVPPPDRIAKLREKRKLRERGEQE